MFESRTIVADALSMHPKARWVFAAYHLGGCNACNLAQEETLEQVAEGYRIPLEQFLADLNSLG
jgi:hybrid cluster-associated redox disulfide protein